MPHAVRMPTRYELPAGARREFVEELFDHYRAARRPTLREISVQIEVVDARKQLATAVSRETIRRMFLGRVVPKRWATVEAVLYGLCEISGRDPHGARWPDDRESPNFADELERRWNDAIDADSLPAPNPWSTTSDEPPF